MNTGSSKILAERTPTIHMLFGYLGSGKTTLARNLEQKYGAVRFSADEWMVVLFGNNPPSEKFADYALKIERLIELNYKKILELRIDVVLDIGFWKRVDRDKARALALSLGAIPRLYYLQCSEATMMKRVLDRNNNLQASKSLYIDENAFHMFKNRLEPLGPDEDHEIIVTES